MADETPAAAHEPTHAAAKHAPAAALIPGVLSSSPIRARDARAGDAPHSPPPSSPALPQILLGEPPSDFDLPESAVDTDSAAAAPKARAPARARPKKRRRAWGYGRDEVIKASDIILPDELFDDAEVLPVQFKWDPEVRKRAASKRKSAAAAVRRGKKGAGAATPAKDERVLAARAGAGDNGQVASPGGPEAAPAAETAPAKAGPVETAPELDVESPGVDVESPADESVDAPGAPDSEPPSSAAVDGSADLTNKENVCPASGRESGVPAVAPPPPPPRPPSGPAAVQLVATLPAALAVSVHLRRLVAPPSQADWEPLVARVIGFGLTLSSEAAATGYGAYAKRIRGANLPEAQRAWLLRLHPRCPRESDVGDGSLERLVLVEWASGASQSLVVANEANERCPRHMIEFYRDAARSLGPVAARSLGPAAACSASS